VTGVNYRKYWQENPFGLHCQALWQQHHLNKQDAQWLRTTLPDLKIQSICDLGCGGGRLLSVLKELVPEVVGVDFTPGHLEGARKVAREIGAEVCYLDVTLGRLNRMFDAVFSTQLLLHIPPKLLPKAFANMAAMASKYMLHIFWHREGWEEFKDVADYTNAHPGKTRNSFLHDIDSLMAENNFEAIAKTKLFIKSPTHYNIAWVMKRLAD